LSLLVVAEQALQQLVVVVLAVIGQVLSVKTPAVAQVPKAKYF
jgi:hypothetical protein